MQEESAISNFNTVQYCMENNIPCFSVKITYENNEKKIIFPKEWTSIEKPRINKNHNGLAIRTGSIFWAIDFDNCFEQLPQHIQELLMNSCKTIVKTRRGFHFYFKTCEETSNYVNKSKIAIEGNKYLENEGGIDIRAKGGCVIAPPSSYKIKTDTIKYSWYKGTLETIDIAPVEILNLFEFNNDIHTIIQTNNIENKWKDIEDAVNMLSEERASSYNEWIAVIWALKNTENSERSLDLAHNFSQRTLKMNQYNPREVDNIFRNGRPGYTTSSIFYWAMKDNPEAYYARFNLQQLEEFVFRGDIGLAELYALENKTKVICTCQNANSPDFYMFHEEDGLWHESTGNDIKRHFCLTMEGVMKPLYDYYTRKINEFTGKNENEEKLWVMKRFELGKVMKHVHNNFCARNVLPFICSALYDASFFGSLNKIKHLLPVANGVIDLRNGELIKREAHHKFTFALTVPYNKHSKTDNWNKYFNQVFQNDTQVVDWIQTYLGYTLTGETNLQRIVVFWGSGSNSKSVLLGFINKLFKDNHSEDSAKSNLFCTFTVDDVSKKDSPNRDGLYNAKFSRAAVLIESPKNSRLDEELLKQMSGQDPVSVSGKYKNQITFIPQFKFYIITNNKPKFDSDEESKATWRRVILVPFETIFKDKDSLDWDDTLASEGKMCEKDEKFISELNNNMEGLLKWLVEGSIRYYTTSEKVPKKLLEATNEYKKSCNNYYNWLQENYYKTEDENDIVLADDLLEHWKKENPRIKENDKGISIKIGNALKEWKLIKNRKTSGNRDYYYPFLKKKEED
jgi:P4 family phage/plasmid primase-like protien